MDRTRESRRSSMVSSTNGFPRRRHRTIALRDSSEEGAMELREGASKRGRNRDRDRDSANRSKRRRGSHSHRDEGEQSTEESVGNEQDDDVQDAGISKIRSANTMSSASDQNHRRSLTPARPPPFKITEEMIGVTVPRKARSASVKRSHESWVSAGGGGEDQNCRQRSNSPGSGEPASPSSSNVSAVRKKMKAIEAVPKTSKSPSSEIEIEIAELLYGLKTSKNHESSSKMLEASVNHHASLSYHVEKKNVEDNNFSTVVPNNSAEELVRIRREQPADVDCHDGGAIGHENESLGVLKADVGEEKVNSGGGFGASADERSVSSTRESPSFSKLNADEEDAASTRVMSAVPEANTQRVGKFEIDLMAPPPMVLSPEGDDLSRDDFTSETKSVALDVGMREDTLKVEDKVERPVNKEKTPEEIKEANMVTFKENLNVIQHDLERPSNDNDNDMRTTNSKLEEQDRNKELPTISSISKVEKAAQSISMSLSTTESRRPSSLSSIRSITMIGRHMPPLQQVLETDKTTGSLTPQYLNFVPSQPQPKRCATHYYIACNILHQQFTKMTPPLPAAIGSSSLCGAKPNNVNSVPSAESMIFRKQSQKHLSTVNQNATQEKGQVTSNHPSLSAAKSSNNANPMDSTTQRVQLMVQQGSNPGSTGNLVHGPVFLYPPGQHQASVAAATNQAGGVNSPNSVSSYNKTHGSVGGSLGTSSNLPVVAPAISFSYPNFSANGSPYMTIVHNNGYSFPFSTSIGATAATRGASAAQATHLLNGPFYSSQTFHPLQHPHQHSQSQALVQPSYLNASTSSGSSSHKQSQGVQSNGNNTSTSTTVEQQSQKRQTSLSHLRKHEIEMGGGNVPSVVNRPSYPQKNMHGQNFTIPVQPVNLSFKPSATSDIVSGNGGNVGDKLQQQQNIKGGVEIIPSQAFAISFAAFNGTSVPSNLNFSSMTQNPVILHSLPDIAWQGYQAACTPHTTQQKTYPVTEAKSGGNSSHQDDEKKTTHGKSSTNGPTTLVFDNSSKNLNFVLSPTNGNRSSHTTASTAITSVPLSSNASSSQQPPQLLQLQKQSGMQQHQPSMATRYKASSTNTTATKYTNNAHVFSPPLSQSKSSNQASHTKTSGRSTDSHVHHPSIINTPTLKKISQEQGRVLQGHMQISFGGNYITSVPPQGQQLPNSNQPLCATAAGTPFSGGNMKPNSEGSKVSLSVNTSQSQQAENSSAGNGQKSSPVCGRNVPSILSSCPSHLSELKY
ncbi:protein TIME FOR COFFEE-like isoform X2 [Abrus precatorius]|uniref:Protein TIME FOR COFFEE-like isoform X2 n=1 Tax=Abrus precatorius TaxID=3816 RepID=A0A8B8M6C6_ABRPR|nr:protein TIME FOR COFFEE-like isoform X2 [Abrus precatorius]